MKPNATLWVIGSYHNIFRVGAILQDLGFWILNDIVWRKANPMPNFRGRRFTNAHETLIWAAKGADAKGYTFNYEALKAGNDDVQMRSDWFLPLCTGEERLKDARRPQGAPDPEARGAARARDARGVASRATWSSTRSSARARPARWRSGSGGASSASSATAPMRRRRSRRIAAVEPLAAEAIAPAPAKRAEPRVPFLSVVEGGLVSPGEALVDERRRHKALVRAGRHAGARARDRLDPQDRRARPGPAGLQRLDLLARRAQRRARFDRRLPGNRARRDGHRLIWSAAARRNVSPGRELPLQNSSEWRRQ